jgi:hypothetical protein
VDLRELALNKNPKRHPWELARIKVVKTLIADNLEEIKKSDSVVLDIGCGDIFLIEQISEEYPHVQFAGADIEFNEEIIQILEERVSGKKISIFDSLDAASSSLNKEIDIVFLLDVIEHIEDEISFLSDMIKNPFITERTKVLITVPAFQSLFADHDVFLGHYRRYTNKSLKNRVEEAGLIVDKVGYFFFILIFYRLLELLKEKLSKKKDNDAQGIGDWDKGPVISKLMLNLMFIDFKICYALSKIGIKFPGLSNYAICRKPAS